MADLVRVAVAESEFAAQVQISLLRTEGIAAIARPLDIAAAVRAITLSPIGPCEIVVAERDERDVRAEHLFRQAAQLRAVVGAVHEGRHEAAVGLRALRLGEDGHAVPRGSARRGHAR